MSEASSRKEALSPVELRELSRISPARSTLSMAKTAALAAGCIAAAVLSRGHAWHPLVVVAAIFGVAGAQHQLAVLAHEGAHFRSYQTRWLNDLVGALVAAPLGLSMRTYRLLHNIHHHHLYEPSDPDLALMAGYPRGRAYLVRKLAKDLLGITTLKNYAYFVGRPQGERRVEGRAAAARERRLVAIANIAFLAISMKMGF